MTPRQAGAVIKGLPVRPNDRWHSMEEFYEALCAPERPHTEENRRDDETRPEDRRPPSALRKFLCKGRGPKQISVLHILTAVLILGGAFAGLIWFNRSEPFTPEQERRAMLMEMGGFRLGDLSYAFIVPDLPAVLVSGYVGTDTEVTIPEEANGFPVTGIGIFALKERGLKTVYLPDSITYDPIGFPEGCTVIGGQPEEAGVSSLEQQLAEAAKAAEAE